MDKLWQDLGYAARSLVRNPGFAIVAVLTLALGIGANTAIFSVVKGVLLEPLPFEDADRLVKVGHWYPELGLEASVSASGYTDYQAQERIFRETALSSNWGANVAAGDQPARLQGAQVTPSYFRTLGVRPHLGRAFLPEEAEPGRNRVVILGHGVWTERFGGSPGVLDEPVRINGEEYRVVGVMPSMPEPFDAEVWAPLAFTPAQLTGGRTAEAYQMIARLQPGVTAEEARAHLAALATRLQEQGGYPGIWGGFWLTPLQETIVGDVRPALLILLGAVGLVLLIACANVANLLLARASARRREVAVRTALGARRGRLVRQLLTESMFLALLGGAAGLVLASWATGALVALDPGNLPRVGEIGLDRGVLAFAFAVSIAAGVLFGLLPALQTSRIEPQKVLREEGGRGGGAFGHRGMRRAVVVSEIALALILMAGAGLLIKSFIGLQQVDPGFRAENVLTMQLTLPPAKYETDAEEAAFYRDLLREVEALPGVRSAGAVSVPPLSGWSITSTFGIEGHEVPEGGRYPWGEVAPATPGYFETMGIPLIRGRFFSPADDAGARSVAIVDLTLVERYWPDEDPIGQRLAFGLDAEGNPEWFEVVGVVGHVMTQGIETDPRTQIYVPHAQHNWGSTMFLAVRTATDPAQLTDAVRQTVLRVDPEQPVYNVKTMSDYVEGAFAQSRFTMMLLATFAAVALILAGIGIYGVMSYAVTQRTRELGIRIALGAERRRVLGLVLRQGLAVAAIGIGLGLLGALALARVMASQLYGVGANDPWTFAGVALLFTAIALLATYIPARRATRVDPMVALRYE